MVLIKFKNASGEEAFVKFLMKTKEAEIKLVNKFTHGLVNSNQVLNLGQLGKIPVKDIINMTRLENTETVHKNNVHGSLLDDTMSAMEEFFGKKGM